MQRSRLSAGRLACGPARGRLPTRLIGCPSERDDDRMEMGSFAYNVVLLLHLGLVIVGFGSSFVYPVLATKSRALDYKERYALDHAVFGVQKYLTTFPIYGAILAGIGLVVISEM